MLCAESSLELPDSALEVVIREVLVKFWLPGFTRTFTRTFARTFARTFEERLYERDCMTNMFISEVLFVETASVAGIYDLRRLQIKRCGRLGQRAVLTLDCCPPTARSVLH